LLVVLINCMDPSREVNLKHGELYSLTDMAVTSDNKLLLCNCESSHPKVYIYKDYKTYEDEISFTSRPECITVDCFNVDILNFFKLHVNFINCRLTRPMTIRETSSTAYNIMLTTEIINLDVCVYFTVYFRGTTR
jgi:hypothetical protein